MNGYGIHLAALILRLLIYKDLIMAINNFEQFAKAVVSIADSQQNVGYDSLKFGSALSDLNYALAYGSPTLPESEITGIRNSDGFVYFMVGQDTVGSVARVHRGEVSA